MNATCIEFFAGAGGAAVGLHQAGFESLLRVEWDHDACETLRAAFPGERLYEGDIRRLHFGEGSRRPFLAWASPPCQPASSAGKRKGAQDARNGWPWTFDAIDRLAAVDAKPEVVLTENVTGQVQHKTKSWCIEKCKDALECSAGSTELHVNDGAFEIIGSAAVNEDRGLWALALRDARLAAAALTCARCYWDHVVVPGFEERYAYVEWRILDAADYGVPQRRLRVILMASSKPIAWPEPTHSQAGLAVAKWLHKTYWAEHGIELRGSPSKAEHLILDRIEGLKGTKVQQEAARRAARLRRWRTVRDALDLEGMLHGERNSSNHPGQERVRSTDEPRPAIGGQRNQMIDVRVVGGGTNPHGKSAEHERTERDLTDDVATTIAVGNPSGNNAMAVEVRSQLPQSQRAVLPDQPSDAIQAGTDSHRAPYIDTPSPAVLASEVKGARHMNNMDPNRTPMRASDMLYRVTDGKRRRLTVAECALLQDFPVDYPFQGNKTSRYKQVGNAVPATLARVLAEAVLADEE